MLSSTAHSILIPESLHSPISCSHSSCKEIKGERIDKTFQVAEKIAAFALGIFAFLESAWLFIPSFFIGTCIGIITHKSLPIEHDALHSSQHQSSCSHGFVEQLTGVKLPRALALAAGFAVTVAHIDHHGQVFVPIVGVTLGIWFGQLIEPNVSLAFRKMTAFVSHPFKNTVLASNP